MNSLQEVCQSRIVIVAHRGVSGGNIPCNTMAAYQIALKQGADMIEIDLNRTADGHLVIFHPKMEPKHLGYSGSIRDHSLSDIQSMLRYVNYDRTPTEWTLCTFDEVLEEFKNKCFINVDKFWDYPEEISEAIKKHGMEDQILVKSSPKPGVFDFIETLAPNIMFMPIFVENAGNFHEDLLHRRINYVGAELVFPNEECEVGSEAFRQKLKKDGKLLWGNAILYNYRVQLAAGHSDDESMIHNPDNGWGWLIDHGFNIIQTDWVLPLKNYFNQRVFLNT